MSDMKSFVEKLRQVLTKALCIVNFPSRTVERVNRPEVEYQDSEELLLEPITLTRGPAQKCLIERSINSVRISLRVKYSDALEAQLTKTYLRYLMQRAESFSILRRVPVPGYDISFLITSRHCELYDWRMLVELICDFVRDAHAEFNSLKLLLNARNRTVATDFRKSLVLPELVSQYHAVDRTISL